PPPPPPPPRHPHSFPTRRSSDLFGRATLWLTLGVVGTITLGLTAQAVRLGIGVPHEDTTQIAELARVAAPAPVFAAFQGMTALLDRKSTRLNSCHRTISYAVFCL